MTTAAERTRPETLSGGDKMCAQLLLHGAEIETFDENRRCILVRRLSSEIARRVDLGLGLFSSLLGQIASRASANALAPLMSIFCELESKISSGAHST